MITRSVQDSVPAGRIPNSVYIPGSDRGRDEVRDQLRRILSSPAFYNSKRYAAVLKFLVDQTLDGFGDRLKERTIGIEVFDRPPDYDTATDHAVRSAVAEVRKRLAQYYLHNAQDELRIEILPGSYTPQFRQHEAHPSWSAGLPRVVADQTVPVTPPAPASQPVRRSRPRAVLIAAGLILTAGILAVVADMRARDPLDSFWMPIFKSHAPILLCIGNIEGGETLPADGLDLNHKLTLSEFHNSKDSTVNQYDAFTMAKFAGLLEAHGQVFRFASQSDATFTDLQSGPTILVGLLNNNWTKRLVPQLRFTVEEPTPGKIIIRDRNNLANNDWSIDYSTPYLDVTKDYAIVLRMVDPKTDQAVIVDAGITVFGTSAAGNFLTNRNEMKKLTAIAPSGWEKKNMELVLSTDVIHGQSGPASIIAAQFW